MIRIALLAAIAAVLFGISGCSLCGPCGPHAVPCGDPCCGTGWDQYPCPATPLEGLRNIRRSLLCGAGCGEVYYGDWVNHPPDCNNPCDNACPPPAPACGGCGSGCGGCGCCEHHGCRPFLALGLAIKALYGKRFCDGCGHAFVDCCCGPHGGGHVHGGYADGGYIDGGYVDDGYIEGGYANEGYIESGPSSAPCKSCGSGNCGPGGCKVGGVTRYGRAPRGAYSGASVERATPGGRTTMARVVPPEKAEPIRTARQPQRYR